MAGSKNTTKTSNGSGSKTGGKGKAKEGKKDAGGEGGSEGGKEGATGGKLKPATAINSRHILVSSSFPLLPLLEREGGRIGSFFEPGKSRKRGI